MYIHFFFQHEQKKTYISLRIHFCFLNVCKKMYIHFFYNTSEQKCMLPCYFRNIHFFISKKMYIHFFFHAPTRSYRILHVKKVSPPPIPPQIASTLNLTTKTSFCRTELLWAPFLRNCPYFALRIK